MATSILERSKTAATAYFIFPMLCLLASVELVSLRIHSNGYVLGLRFIYPFVSLFAWAFAYRKIRRGDTVEAAYTMGSFVAGSTVLLLWMMSLT